MNGNQTYAVRQMVEQLESQVETLQTQASAFNTAAANTQVLFRDGTTINGDSGFVFDKTNDLVTVGLDSVTTIPARRQRIFGNVRVDAGTNNPNGVELRVIGPTIPYHSHQMINGLANGFAANSDHSHCLWANFSTGTTQQTQQAQEIYTVSGGLTSFVNYGFQITALGVEFANEVSIDTTATVQNPVAPDYIGRILLRYSANPGIVLGENLLFETITVQVAGIQAAVYAATAATASVLVGSLWEVQIDVVGLDPIHWNWNNRQNTTELTANWRLNRTITPLTGLVTVTAVGVTDTTALNLVFNPIPAQLATVASIGYPITFLIKQASSITGLNTGVMYTGYVSALTYGVGVTATVRLRNARYQFWQNIGGTDANPGRFNVYPGIRDVAHDPAPYNAALIHYRNANGIPRAVSLGGNDFTPSINRAVAVGMGLVADASDEVVIGTDNVTNKVRIRNNGIQLGEASVLLDKYQIFTDAWNPVLDVSPATCTISVNSKRFYQIGSIAYFSVNFDVLTLVGVPSICLLYLPFESSVDVTVSVSATGLSATATTSLGGLISAGSDAVQLFSYAAGTQTQLGSKLVAGATRITVSGTFIVT
jgi:hypothetical protein